MDVQGVQRIPNLVRHTGGQKGERLDAFALDGFVRFLPRLRGVVQDQRHAAAARRLAIQRRRVEPEKTRARSGI